jgi:hypothetical protein
MKTQILSILVGLTLVGCATTPDFLIEPGADKVELVEYLPPLRRSELVEINMVTCELGMNAKPQELNIQSCKNKLRNEAQKLGGIVVLMEPEKQKIGKDSYNEVSGNMYCPNCVTLRGVVYGPKAKK